MKMTYHRKGDYLFPNLKVMQEESAAIGKYGMLRETYLRENHPNWYTSMTLTGKLNRHLAEVETSAQEMMETLMPKLLQKYPAPDKSKEQLQWVAHMNNLTAMAEETVLAEVVYN
ncbi:MAG: TnpV protein [Oscillospiraceae bacterium]|nr:TnpV protein [Oscillospiraceae bacterium]